jgi:hypothetical protein
MVVQKVSAGPLVDERRPKQSVDQKMQNVTPISDQEESFTLLTTDNPNLLISHRERHFHKWNVLLVKLGPPKHKRNENENRLLLCKSSRRADLQTNPFSGSKTEMLNFYNKCSMTFAIMDLFTHLPTLRVKSKIIWQNA